MIEHPNSFLVHQCLQAITNADTETLRALWADDIVWLTKGPWPLTDEVKGQDAIFEFLASLGDAGVDTYQIDIDDVMIGEERATIVLSVRASRGAKNLDTRVVVLARIVGRRVHEIIVVPIDSDHIEEFWRA